MNHRLPPSALASRPAERAPRFIDCHAPAGGAAPASAAQEIASGLLLPSAALSPKFFYDALGSKLFEAITALTEYYPTRTEAAIFAACQHTLAGALGAAGISAPCLIDLGAGNCAKAAALIPHLQPAQYVPVDISADFLRDAAQGLQGQFPALDILALGMDFSSDLSLPPEVQLGERVFFYPGSSLGNFGPADAVAFLKRMADPAKGNARGLLLGVDLVKDTATLEAAYDDAVGVTAAFNKNMLRHVNSLLQSDFDLRQWRHVARFDTALSRIEMHLEAVCDLTVQWTGPAGAQSRHFAAGERIHTESSYKYTVPAMTALLNQAGFAHVEHWTDPQQWFGVFWARV